MDHETGTEANADVDTEAGARREAAQPTRGITRRTVLKGVGVAGAAAGLTGLAAAPAEAEPQRPDPWWSFGREVRAEFRRMRLVGAAVAVVSRDRVLHEQPLGVRDLRSRRVPVNDRTRFFVASTTKSMSSLLVATYIDQGRFGWDDRVVDAWPGFRAPTDELTETLRVRDLLGMATGLSEPPASSLHQGDPTALQLLQLMDNLAVTAEPNRKWIYNNTVYAVGGYLPFLNAGVNPDRLAGAYANEMRRRVFVPTGMTGARITDDPRGLVNNYTRGHGLDLSGANSVLNYGAVGSYAPVGATLASLDDMAAYVQLQLRGGRSIHGRRVVSAANLAECWKPHVPVPTSPVFDPDVESSGYAMGWIRNTFRDGTSLVWHNGAIDGFTAYIGFLPERNVGLVVLNALNPFPTGFFFYTYVLNLLLNRYGLNEGVPAKVHDEYENTMRTLRALGRQTRPVHARAVEPWLGHYEGGYRLSLRGRELILRQGPRELPIRALTDGDYVMYGGLLVQQTVRLRRDADGTPLLELDQLETVRRTVGLD